MNNSEGVYKHSGALGPAIFIVPLGGIAGMIILSFIYAYISVYSPIAGYISIFFVGGFGFSLGLMLSLLGHWGKCRNTGFLYLAGFIIGLLALYVSWVIFIYALLNKGGDGTQQYDLFGMMLSPGGIWAFMKSLNATGWYSIKSWTPSGTALWVFWGIEAAIILGLSTLLSTSSIDSEMFCESCEKWCDTSESFLSDFPKEEVSAEELENSIVETLSACDLVSDSIYPRINVTLYECKSCSNFAGCKLEAVTVEIDKDGKPDETKEDMTGIISLSYNKFTELKALGKRKIIEPDMQEEAEAADTAEPENVS